MRSNRWEERCPFRFSSSLCVIDSPLYRVFPCTPPKKMQYAILWLSSITASHLLPPCSSREVDGLVVWSVSFGVAYGLSAPRAPLGVPTRKPFLNLRETSDRERMRPVPVVFLRLAFSDQLSIHPAD